MNINEDNLKTVAACIAASKPKFLTPDEMMGIYELRKRQENKTPDDEKEEEGADEK